MPRRSPPIFLRLKQQRLIRAWTQADVAQLAHMRQQEISLVEQARLRPTADQLERLGRAFGKDPESLLQPVAEAEG